MKQNMDLQAVDVSVSAKKTLTICNIYRLRSQDVNFSDLEHLVEQIPALFVLIEDFNAHSPLWGWCETGLQRSNVREKKIKWLQSLPFKHWWTHIQTPQPSLFFLFQIYRFMINPLHLNLTGKLQVITSSLILKLLKRESVLCPFPSACLPASNWHKLNELTVCFLFLCCT